MVFNSTFNNISVTGISWTFMVKKERKKERKKEISI